MVVNKCQYFNNHQTACSLMIDDIVPVAVSVDGKVGPWNDWGYLMDKEESLFNYFKQTLLNKYPEIKGTIFLPLESQNYITEKTGYKLFKRNTSDPVFIDFLKKLMPKFEMAFHGVKHAYFDEKDKFIHECSNLDDNSLFEISSKVKSFGNETNILFTGGKFPGYKFNETALQLIKELDAKWWALSSNMIDNSKNNNHIITDSKTGVSLIPTNLSGNIFFNAIKPESFLRKQYKRLKRNHFYKKPIDYLFYLYENKFPITIQEHFQNQSALGRRQPLNIYDDIWSLDQIFGILRGLDIWHTTISHLAHYHDCYNKTILDKTSDNSVSLKYNGIWEELYLSIALDVPKVYHYETDSYLSGVLKNGKWIFNEIPEGKFKI
jgi:hypothetical protein